MCRGGATNGQRFHLTNGVVGAETLDAYSFSAGWMQAIPHTCPEHPAQQNAGLGQMPGPPTPSPESGKGRAMAIFDRVGSYPAHPIENCRYSSVILGICISHIGARRGICEDASAWMTAKGVAAGGGQAGISSVWPSVIPGT